MRDRRTRVVKVRVSPRELERWARLAAQRRLFATTPTNVSAMVRGLVNDACDAAEAKPRAASPRK